ncbi:Pyruvate kinase, alpha/beta domain [Methanosarcina siciliae C2J]|uniref:Pyruvate kinase, alpha/beta domain n=2 Tax=Methanosarcina siciliae TaxID=38027 RepID=A0A0E3PJB3_9EURY|nr:pyruvate kinase alpha/beta domain-containing protein [Methanosarcina siciliae]AKB34328.1 Pyruvate kinase, alpha/beta domain [Methanosarcina siciliae HI350]AKB38692.1 Pyruvate kinase, alpha/beta domain [Methanosarcina siciliae C2J]
MEKPILYLDSVGEENTDAVVEAAAKRAAELGIAHIVVASTSGKTALKMAEAVKASDIKVIGVSHQYGQKEKGEWEVEEEYKKKLEELGAVITTQSHMFSGIERSITKKFGGYSRLEVIADTLRSLFGKGFKVAIEVAIMAADSGHIPVSDNTEIIAIGGTRQGADVALVLRPAHSNDFFSLQVREIIAMPRAKED